MEWMNHSFTIHSRKISGLFPQSITDKATVDVRLHFCWINAQECNYWVACLVAYLVC